MLSFVLQASTTGTPSFWGYLMDLSDTITSKHLSEFESIGITLAAMLAAFSIIHIASSYTSGQRGITWEIVRPVLVLFVVMNFNLFTSAFDGVVNIFTRDVVKVTNVSSADLMAPIKAYEEAANLEVQKKAKELENRSWFRRVIIEGVSSGFKKVFDLGQLSSISFINILFIGLGKLIFVVYQCLAFAFLTLLKLMGPIIFALSINEEFKKGLVGWITKYVQISLWTPMGYLIMFFVNELSSLIGELVATGSIVEGYGASALSLSMVITMLISLFSIPKLCGWIIEASGVTEITSSMAGNAKGAATAAAGAI